MKLQQTRPEVGTEGRQPDASGAGGASGQSSRFTLHSSIGTQVRLPFSTAFRISVQGIRIRFGRSLVTVSGVVLGIAFLMSNLTGQLIKNAVAAQREVRQQASMMAALVRSEIGEVKDKKLAVAVFGSLSATERELLASLLAAKPASFRGLGLSMPGVTPATADDLGVDAGLLLILGNSGSAPESLANLTHGMAQRVVLDSEAARTFATGDAPVRRELFFGAQHEQQKARMAKEARQARARTLWIVVISLLVTVIGVSNALLMSVTERFREIGTMKCLGALSSFIRKLFLIESSLIGAAGSIIGAVAGAILPIVAYGFTYSFATVLGSMPYGLLALAGVASAIVGNLLAVAAAIYPAAIASRMLPASALRSTV
ncbi:MAG: ABC transporter permease [bacterium]